MGPSSSEDEETSTTGAFPEGPPAQTPVIECGARRPPVGTLVVVVIQKMSAVA
jgi:hypothetical protein